MMEVKIKAEEKDGKTKITTINVNGDCKPISTPVIASGMAKVIIHILEDSCMSNTSYVDLLLISRTMFNNEIYKELGRIDKKHKKEKKNSDDSDKEDSTADDLIALLKGISKIMSDLLEV